MGYSRAVLVLALVSAVVVVAGCAPGDRNPATEEATPLSVPEGSDDSRPPIEIPGAVNYQGSTQLGDAHRLGIELQNFAFAPTFVEAVPAAAGRAISVTLENVSSGTDHTFTIDGAGVDVEVPANTDARIDLAIPPSPGRLVYYCRYHRAQGMQGAFFLAGPSL
jgi:plastocyanin